MYIYYYIRTYRYNDIQQYEQDTKEKVEQLLCCGDFQSLRSEEDLESLACIPKYKKIGCFKKYYNGEKVAPVLTIFIHGNHEASNYQLELPFGGWVAPNIYYLGFASVINFRQQLRIGGFSGIYSRHSYHSGHHETIPLNSSTIRSVYHCRDYELYQLLHIEQPIDIFLTHDWPNDITAYGNCNKLLKKKPYFRTEVQEHRLGNPAHELLLWKLRPAYWFSAHLHVKFVSLVKYDDDDSICTQFLALDKVVPNRKYLQILDIPILSNSSSLYSKNATSSEISYDPEWLAILQKTLPLFPIQPTSYPLSQFLPNIKLSKTSVEACKKFLKNITVEEIQLLEKQATEINGGTLYIDKENFVRVCIYIYYFYYFWNIYTYIYICMSSQTAPNTPNSVSSSTSLPKNPQTLLIYKLLNINNPRYPLGWWE